MLRFRAPRPKTDAENRRKHTTQTKRGALEKKKAKPYRAADVFSRDALFKSSFTAN